MLHDSALVIAEISLEMADSGRVSYQEHTMYMYEPLRALLYNYYRCAGL